MLNVSGTPTVLVNTSSTKLKGADCPLAELWEYPGITRTSKVDEGDTLTHREVGHSKEG